METGGHPESAAIVDPLVGRNVGGKFLLERQLGAGAMGAVYKARQTALEKVVAIKVMHGELANDPMFAARFHREAKAASRLDHPNSIRILDYGQDPDGLLYIAMEFLDGRDLGRLLMDDWPLTKARVIDLMSQALGAIAVAHDMGITHRDLKPENIMVLERQTDDGARIDVVKVCDFGIAKVADAGDDAKAATLAVGMAGAGTGTSKGKLTTAGLVIGTPAYMSPEQGRGEAIDGRSDLYSMGVILYQLLAGQLPFDAPSAIGLVVKHQTEVPVPPSSMRTGVDPHLESVCLKALEKLPSARYQTARDLRSAVRAGPDAAVGALSRDAIPPVSVPAVLRLEPEAATARTELQLAAVPTAAAAVLGPRPVEKAPEGAPAGRSWLGYGAALVMIVSVAAGVGYWRSRPEMAVIETSERRVVAQTESPSPSSPLAALSVAPSPLRPTSPQAVEPAIAAAASVDTMASTKDVGGKRAAAAVTRRLAPGAGAAGAAGRGATNAEVAVTQPAPVPAAPAPVAVAPPPPEPPSVPAPPVPGAPAPAVPATPAANPATATVVIGAPTHTELLSAGKVSTAFAHVTSAIQKCYRDNLLALGPTNQGHGTLHIQTDDGGQVQKATLSGPVGGSVASCIQAVAMTVTIRDADTGQPSAEIPLEFKAQ